MRKRSNLTNRGKVSRYVGNVISEPKKKYVDNFVYCEYNEEISKKFYKFLDLCLQLSFDIQNDDSCIILSLNLSDYDKKANSSTSVSIFPNEDYITFFISKTHFKISKNHMDVCGYRDENIYQLYKLKIKEFHENKNGICR